MNRNELQVLETQIRNRIDELQELVKHSQEDAQASAEADALQDTELGLKFAEKDRLELERLRSNLLWLASDKGGCCAECGCDIPLPRLRAVPATRLCVNCASIRA
ncbi:MAG: TraR/DksA C4-type zinc finger protein [Pseudomonadota bacterium]|nr:TraR/DksA C4-type zinc finger protein [Pseudomonadota bacterium]